MEKMQPVRCMQPQKADQRPAKDVERSRGEGACYLAGRKLILNVRMLWSDLVSEERWMLWSDPVSSAMFCRVVLTLPVLNCIDAELQSTAAEL